jgi:hypothetical protein
VFLWAALDGGSSWFTDLYLRLGKRGGVIAVAQFTDGHKGVIL